MSKPWGGIGAWAAEAEREEAEEREQAAVAAAAAAVSGGARDSQAFPSLKEAVTTKPKKKKMTLQEFNNQTAAGGGGGGRRDSAQRLTPDEMSRLPTGPKERSEEEMQYGRLGGGFSSYGRSDGGRSGRMRDRDGDGDTSWGGGNRRSYGGFDDDGRGPPPRAMDFDQPSRADEADNWAMGKKPQAAFDSGRPNRYSSLGGGSGGGDSMSRADEVDNWAVGKRPIAPARSSTFGSNFSNPRPETDRWAREGSREVERERPRLVLNPPSGDGAVVEQVKTNRSNPFGAARPREDVLAEKGLDWRKQDSEIEAKKTSRPTSSHSSRPSSAHSNRSEGLMLQGPDGAVKPKPKVNPFGDAKPREILLQEKGMDWRKIDLDLEHRRVDRPETEEEKNLKEEIELLKKEVEKEKESALVGNEENLQVTVGEDKTGLKDQIFSKERDLELLIRELDDKVRFGQKATERPNSAAGRGAAYLERPSSRSGLSEESRNMEFTERPQSRGNVDAWPRQGGEDRRGSYQGGGGGGRERGFLGNREVVGSRPRERW